MRGTRARLHEGLDEADVARVAEGLELGRDLAVGHEAEDDGGVDERVDDGDVVDGVGVQ